MTAKSSGARACRGSSPSFRALSIWAAFLPIGPLAAQEPAPGPPPLTAGDAAERDRIVGKTVVTATRTERATLDVPYATDVVSDEQIRRRAYRTLPQVLRDTPGAYVQETAPGQGSPYLRGFTGYLNLLLIDGVRLNNSVFRSGPNQYWATVDPWTVERLEVVKGPGSVLYGSDAVGGTVNAITRSPWTFGAESAGTLLYRGSTAERSHAGRAEASVGLGSDTGILVGGTGRLYGDVEGGRDVGRQPGTGYEEGDVDVKVEHFLGGDARLAVAYQRVRMHDVPRTHSTVDGISFEGTSLGTDLRRESDQTRELAYVQLHGADGGSIERYSVSLSWHEQGEVEDRIRGSGSRTIQGFEVDTLGLFANATIDTGLGRVTFGGDYYSDDVASFSSSNPVQGPVADDADYDLLGLFVQDEIEATDRIELTLGARLARASADARSVLDPVTSARISIEDDWSSLVGSARILWKAVPEAVHVYGGVSQGFRAPNLSDLTRFDAARSNEFEIPAPGLEPEDYLSYELGLETRRGGLEGEAAVFYTDVEDQIVRFPTGNVNGSGDAEVTKANVGDGYVWGVEAGAAWDVDEDWTLFGGAAWIEGKVDNFPSSTASVEREYLGKMMPFNARLGVRYVEPTDRWWTEAVVVHAADADRLSSADESDTQRIPPGGTPGYTVLDLRAGVEVREGIELALGLENLLDEDYRIHGSGSNQPGRNLIVSLILRL